MNKQKPLFAHSNATPSKLCLPPDAYLGIVEDMLRQEAVLYPWVGCDEAGRGPLAGPVSAAAVCFKPEHKIPEGIDDSKKLSQKKRELLYEKILEASFCKIVDVEAARIDTINILQASLEAMRLALGALVLECDIRPNIVLVDGNMPINELGFPQRTVVHGDALSLHIAAASILAKVHRDHIMVQLDAVYPQYGFAKHKGYPTKAHRQAIAEYGPCPAHRKSFSLV